MLGCGDGTYALLAAKKGASVVGLDISPGMLAAARSRAAAEGEQVTWCQASIAALPFAASTFDVLIAVTVFCFSSDPDLALREASRVLRPGGSLVIGELGRYSAWAVSRRVRGWLGSRTWSGARFWTVRELRRAMETAGLRFDSAGGSVYYPPVALLAEALSPYDSTLSALGQFGAAFIVVKATKR
ncbi:MAG: class I SAM-dependent methyltransferase [Bryobacterales bacterium]|nr:class I SAM-dependent methyltransferase [Bryobacterales bacterium]